MIQSEIVVTRLGSSLLRLHLDNLQIYNNAGGGGGGGGGIVDAENTLVNRL